MKITLATVISSFVIPGAVMLSGCQGILSGIYDEPATESGVTRSGQLYVDASDWGEWHYIDLKNVAENVAVDPGFNPSSLWKTYGIPIPSEDVSRSEPEPEQPGIYTYWYDVFGAGISNYEYQGFAPTECQPEPEDWTLAVHRNNVRTNGGYAAETSFTSIDRLPDDAAWLESLDFEGDTWDQTTVWTVQDRMLSGIIGNQGIYTNHTLSRWLDMEIPPMPPSFSHNRNVFILRLADGTYAALQLADYIDGAGTKCCLTINYKYPL